MVFFICCVRRCEGDQRSREERANDVDWERCKERRDERREGDGYCEVARSSRHKVGSKIFSCRSKQDVTISS
eukprot:scaffold7775_cov61-Cyclotella_meneghiniana.AAC.5